MSSPAMPKPKIPGGYKLYSLPTMGPGQSNIYDLLRTQFEQGAPDIYQKLFGLAGGKEGAFDQLEAPALRQFQQQIAPGIAQRYAGSGIGASSGMQNSLAAAGRDLSENLQAQRLGHMEKSIQNVLGLGDRLLTTPTRQFGLVEKQNLLRDFMQMIGNTGSQFGSMVGSAALMGGL